MIQVPSSILLPLNFSVTTQRFLHNQNIFVLLTLTLTETRKTNSIRDVEYGMPPPVQSWFQHMSLIIFHHDLEL